MRSPIVSAIAPLAVLILLILITGYQAFQLTQRWDGAISTVNTKMTQTVLLNNLHQHLAGLAQQPPKTPEAWRDTRSEVDRQVTALLNINATENTRTFQRLLMLMQHWPDGQAPPRAFLDNVLREPFFNQQLQETQDHLLALQQTTQQTIVWMTATSTFLGLILVVLTVRELFGMFFALQRSRDLNIGLQEEERRRIAQDLHDTVVQDMIDLKRQYAPQKVDRLIDNLRRVCHNLKPQVLEDLGLAAGIEFLASDLRANGIETVTLEMAPEALSAIPKSQELTLFRILQEVSSNIKHHARASTVHISLGLKHPAGVLSGLHPHSLLSARVTDNGVGFDAKNLPGSPGLGGLGLQGIRERVAQLGGQLRIHTQPDQGCAIAFEVPLPGAGAAHAERATGEAATTEEAFRP